MTKPSLEADVRPDKANGEDATSPAPATTRAKLAHRVAATLGGTDNGRLAATLATQVRGVAQYEASVRGGRERALRAGRMMIEQASPDILDAIAEALEVALPPAAARWRELAQQEGLPLIAGWDIRDGSDARRVKLYVNASDASAATRTRLLAALAPGVTGTEAAAVLGMNVAASGLVETKLYVQSADAVALAAAFGAHARALAATARAEGADAGGVISFDTAGGAIHSRAFFVALREPLDGAGWGCVRSLPAYDPSVIAAVLPFAPAPPRSLGISLRDGAWTLYCKPRQSRAPETLEPVAVFRSRSAEVGVFVEPAGARAFRRTLGQAVSVRVRAGRPVSRSIEALVNWFTARLHAAEHEKADPRMLLENPPAPWRLVRIAGKPSSRREKRP